MKKVIFLSDVQDIWLLSYFLENCKNITLVYERTNKITSPHNWLSVISGFGCKTLEFRGVESQEFIDLLKSCQWFITKDNLPFTEKSPFSDKTVSISWVGECLAKNCKTKKLEAGCHRLYIEKQLAAVCKLRNFSNFNTDHPKYYFLNNCTRKAVCQALKLDHNQKYVTIFTNKFFSINPQAKEILTYIKQYCKDNNIKIILKNKLKYGEFLKDEYKHDHYFQGLPTRYHPGIMLQFISEFSIGFSSSASIESEQLGGRFISFWKDPIYDAEYLQASVADEGRAYRLALSEDTFNICTNDSLNNILKQLNDFLEKSSFKNRQLKKFKIDPFLEKLKNV